MQKLPLPIDEGLIQYEKPITFKFQNLDQINSQPPEGKTNVRNILNVLIPPKIISKQISGKNTTYVQYADEEKVSRKDADCLKQRMQEQLKIKKAKIQPICPIRQQIYAEVFAQIIRQVVIDCPERGIMLSRVRNEAYLSIAAYRTLYQQSLKFSKNKLVASQNNLTILQKQKQELLEKQQKLKENQMYLISKKQALQQKTRQIRTIYKEKRQHQLHSLSIQHEGLLIFLAQMTKIKQEQERKQKVIIKKLQQTVSQKKLNN